MGRIALDAALVTAGGARTEPDAFRLRVLAIAGLLHGTQELVNLCEDRGHFLLAFAAALARRRTVLLPPSRIPAAICELRGRFPSSELVDDTWIAAADGPPFEVAPGDADFIAAIGHTSGSTGTPTAHPKSFRSLVATTALNAGTLNAELARQEKSGRPWIVATVPPQHLYGLETSVLLPLLAGFGLHCGRPLMPADVAAALAETPAPRVLVSTPLHLRALVDSPVAYPEVSVVVSATASLPRDLAIRVEGRFGAALIEFFGSTETCVIATRRTAFEEVWKPYPGVVLQSATDGTIVSAPWLAAIQRLHDIVELREDGHFAVVGRGTDVIEVAGKRGSLADLTRRLQSLDGVEDAIVFQPSAPDGGLAGRCAALVVAPGLAAKDIARRMRTEVDAAFVPRPIVMVPKLPRNEVGKLPRERLLQLLATSASRSRRGT